MEDLPWPREQALDQPLLIPPPRVLLKPYAPLIPFELGFEPVVCHNCSRPLVSSSRCQYCLLALLKYSRQLEICIDDRPSGVRRVIWSYNEMTKTNFFTLHFDRVVYDYENPETVEGRILLINELDYTSFRYQLILMKNPKIIRMRYECHYEPGSDQCLTHQVNYPHVGGIAR